MLRKVRLLAVLLTLVLLVAGAAQALPLKGAGRPSETGGVFARVWDWVSALLQSKEVPLRVLWGQDGSHLDPNGGH